MSNASAFDRLRPHAHRLAHIGLPALLQGDRGRARELALRQGPVYFNFARQSYDCEALEALFALARERDIATAFRRLFDGESVNLTEGRAALHTALRGNLSDAEVARQAHATASEARRRMGERVAALEASGITDIVSVG
ncbi:MAG TPA: glucose-6-phosphate isomerase, partial [Pseudoxanthomonas sp.]|nr:glucose-6-phosphate isomerase [Pseudoxanthomonas sp.]